MILQLTAMWLSQLRQSAQTVSSDRQSHVKHDTLMRCLPVSQAHVLSCQAGHGHGNMLLMLVSQWE